VRREDTRGLKCNQGKAYVLILYPQEGKSLAGGIAFGPGNVKAIPSGAPFAYLSHSEGFFFSHL
jgi:hypothetical protein